MTATKTPLALRLVLGGVIACLITGSAAADVVVKPAFLTWTPERDQDSRIVSINTTGDSAGTYRVACSAFTPLVASQEAAGDHEDISGLVLTLLPSEVTLEPVSSGRVLLVITLPPRCRAGRYQAILSVTQGDDDTPLAKGVIVVVIRSAMAVTVLTPSVRAEASGREVSAMASFLLDANVSTAHLSAAATPLFFGGDPGDHDVEPMPLDRSRGVDIMPTSAVPVGGHGTTVSYQGGATGPEQEQCTESLEIVRNNGPLFGETIHLRVFWTQFSHEKPAGGYIGRVKLMGMIVPD